MTTPDSPAVADPADSGPVAVVAHDDPVKALADRFGQLNTIQNLVSWGVGLIIAAFVFGGVSYLQVAKLATKADLAAAMQAHAITPHADAGLRLTVEANTAAIIEIRQAQRDNRDTLREIHDDLRATMRELRVAPPGPSVTPTDTIGPARR